MKRVRRWIGPGLLLAGVACGDSKNEAMPSPSAVSSGDTPAAAPASASGTTPAAASAKPSAAPSASAAPTKAELGKPRALRAGEQAAVERAFPATARFDFTQSFVVELGEGLGSCTFVSQLVEDTGEAPAVAPSAVPAASAAPSVAASASAAPAASAADGSPKPPPVSDFRFHLMCKGKDKVTLPAHDGIEEAWVGHAVKAVTFPDADEDGLREIVIITEMMTGIGPDGAKPFPVVYVYRPDGGSYALDAKLSKKATDDGVATVADVQELMK